MELKDRLVALNRSLPPAQRAGLIVATLVLVMAAVPFVNWVMTPSYTLLYAGMDDRQLGEITTELDTLGVPYQLEGSRVLVPQDQVHTARANLAEVGVSGAPAIAGYELLDEQALGVSDFRQRVDLQRAIEGELARTLSAMDAVESASVRLVMPEEALFTDDRTPATASVLLRPVRQLDQGQIEAITLLVSSAVDGLEANQVTVADTSGQVLHAPGDGTTGGMTDRQQRLTRDFERNLANDLSQLLQRATDAPASVVVRATLDFDESEVQTETFGEDGTAIREQTSTERFEGTNGAAGGEVGVDGGPLPDLTGGEGNYERDDATREFGIDRTTTRTVQAPGTVQGMSVALVVDEEAAVGNAELEALVTAAAGLDLDRGDQVAISRVTTPAMEDVLPAEEGPDMIAMITQGIALFVLVLIVLALLLMSRRKADKPAKGRKAKKGKEAKVVPAQVREPQALSAAEDVPPVERTPDIKQEVSELVERQPEEIAALLRGWLADRRAS
ncbi:MAG: flagellar basal-body MS-ring/collar protein FliF [Nitriliruptoraceae bacterium]